jgi:aspartate/methionine/tyrosine aminotransferase
MENPHNNYLANNNIFTGEQFRYLFDYSFWSKVPDGVLAHNMNSIEGRVFLSDPSVSQTEILFPKSSLYEFLNSNNIESYINDIFSYRTKMGDDRVIDSIIRYQSVRYGQSLKRENILQTIGATNAIDLSMSAIMKQGDSILIPTPSYFTFWKSALNRGYNYDIYFCDEHNRFMPTQEGISCHIKQNTKAVSLIQPLFPSGFRIDNDELIKIIDFLSHRKIFIILDLVYDLLTYDTKKVIYRDTKLGACFERNFDYIVQVNAFSKIWSAPGIRFGYLVASEEIALKAANVLLSSVSRCPVFLAPLYKILMDGTIQMLIDSESEFRKILIYNLKVYKSRMEELVKLVSGSGIEVLQSDAGFNIFIKLSRVPNEHEPQWKFLENLYNRTGVFLDFGSAFGIPHHPQIPTYARVNLGLSKVKLLYGIKKLADFHKEYKSV